MEMSIFAKLIKNLVSEPHTIHKANGILHAYFYRTGDLITWNGKVNGGTCTLACRLDNGDVITRKAAL